ncbi:MAG: tRNA (adenosine(37)-N6)-threonylcarbamoyltransferase complex dimerization subunit type 1 TsaB, partial [Burkholderiaceae bacterium]
MSLPIILALDTATEICSVALLAGLHCIERGEAVGNGHSERILPMVDEVMDESGMALAAVDVIAFGSGPGSFTGLRIACGIAQGLAWSAGKRVVPVGNLRALAARAFAVQTAGDVVLAAIDARMQESYCAVYRRELRNGYVDAVEIRAPSLERPAGLPALASEFEVALVTGNALSVFSGVWPPAHGWIALPELSATAADIARLARGDAVLDRTVAPCEAL